jgi:glycosyltransferase involved in cell wall biosynthesis
MSADRPVIVLVTGADLRRGAPGGTRTYVLGLSRFLVGRGISVSIVGNGPADELASGVRVDSVLPAHVPSARVFQKALRRWGKSTDPSQVGILHFQRPDDGAALPDRFGLSVCTLHGDAWKSVRRRRGRVAARAYRGLERRGIGRFRRLLAVDARTAISYEARYPHLADRVEVVPVAVELEDAPDAPGRPAEYDPPRYLFVGRLSPEKRVDAVIRALSVPGLSGARLRIAGAGPSEAALRRLADGRSVEFLGPLSHERLSHEYRRATALVLASEFEGLPTAALEALASGCPVVAVRGSGLDEILSTDRGVLADDTEDLPRAMDDARRLRASHDRISFPMEYSWSSVGPRILEVYRRVRSEAIS